MVRENMVLIYVEQDGVRRGPPFESVIMAYAYAKVRSRQTPGTRWVVRIGR